LAVYRQKLLNLLKAFQNWQDCHWQAFKSGGRCAACFYNENCSSATYLPDFKTGKIAYCRFSKTFGAARRHLSSNRSKGFEISSFESFQQTQKLWHRTAKNF
jgi:hypothetical protein